MRGCSWPTWSGRGEGGDAVRRPPAASAFIDGESAFFLAVNRGKRSIAVDPKNPEAKRWLDRLVGSADVVLHNLRRGAMERMGYGEDRVREMNPAAVYAVVSAFGPDGPYADRAGIDVIFQAESGMVSITGHPDDPPQKTATTIGDYVAATNAALGVCAALFERQREGRGRRVDVSSGTACSPSSRGGGPLLRPGRQPERTGSASPFWRRTDLPTADGHMALAIVSDRHFEILCEELGRPGPAERNQRRPNGPANRVDRGVDGHLHHRHHRSLGPATRRRRPARPDGSSISPGWRPTPDRPQRDGRRMGPPRIGKVKGIGSPIRLDGAAARAGSAPPTLRPAHPPGAGGAGSFPRRGRPTGAEGAVVVS